MKITEELNCSTGPSVLFPEIEQCKNKPKVYIFGDPYCKECGDKLIEIHAKINSTVVR